jgi:hypothetical protein
LSWIETSITLTINKVQDALEERENMGQLRTYAAQTVALGVAKYIYQVTQDIPGFWSGESPSGPYAMAVLEIFDLLGIPSGSLQRAGEYAIGELKKHHTAKLKSDPEF